MRALLRHATDRARPAMQIFCDSWGEVPRASLLERIENAVYEHPSVLDDYATEIVVETPRLTWAPAALLDEEESAEERIFHTVEAFGAETPAAGGWCAGEVLADRIGEETALYSLCDGFDAFVARTLPGARMRSHMAVLAEKLREMNRADGRLHIYADMRPGGEMDILAFRSGCLISGSVRQCDSAEDAAYRVFGLLNEYSAGPDDAEVHLHGDAAKVEAVRQLTGAVCGKCDTLDFGEAIEQSGLPLAAAMLMYNNRTSPRQIN